MRLMLATRNAHKVREFAQLMAPHAIAELPADVELPPETGTTFAENALIKARFAAFATGETAFADDSGIAAEALGGRPGVYSARFAGEDATDQENLDKLLAEAPAGSRVAYVCAIAYVEPEGEEFVVEARCEGTLAAEPRGSGGFGYDPAFVPDEQAVAGRVGGNPLTMAELAPEEKAAISHRGKAVRALRERLDS